MHFHGADILSIDPLEQSDLTTIFEVAAMMEVYAERQKITRVLEGAVLGNLFFEPSTRSRVSFETAFYRLGGSVTNILDKTATSIVKGESLEDTIRVMGGYADILVIRHPEEGTLKQCATATTCPIISAGDGAGEHPTQALLDLYTIMKETTRSLDEINGLSIAIIGDLKHGRTVHSLVKLLLLFHNIHFSFISPKELSLPSDLLERIASHGHSVREGTDLIHGIHGIDVIYMTRIQEERFLCPSEGERHRGSYSLTKDLYELACGPNARVPILHPLPRDSRPGALEIADDLNNHPALAIFRQARNGIPLRMALFALILKVTDKIKKECSLQ